MRPFIYTRADNLTAAVLAGSSAAGGTPPTLAPVQFFAGGTTILDLMKLDVMRPETLVDELVGGEPQERAHHVAPRALRGPDHQHRLRARHRIRGRAHRTSLSSSPLRSTV